MKVNLENLYKHLPTTLWFLCRCFCKTYLHQKYPVIIMFSPTCVYTTSVTCLTLKFFSGVHLLLFYNYIKIVTIYHHLQSHAQLLKHLKKRIKNENKKLTSKDIYEIQTQQARLDWHTRFTTRKGPSVQCAAQKKHRTTQLKSLIQFS